MDYPDQLESGIKASKTQAGPRHHCSLALGVEHSLTVLDFRMSKAQRGLWEPMEFSGGARVVGVLASFNHSFDKHLSSTSNILGAVLWVTG